MKVYRVMPPHTRPTVHGLPADWAGFVGKNEVSDPYLIPAAQKLPAM